MRALLALAGGFGVFCCYDAWTRPEGPQGGAGTWRVRVAALVPGAPPRTVATLGTASGVGAGIVALVLVGSVNVALVAALAAAVMPVAALRGRERRRRRRQRACWPEAIDLLSGSLRAGETLPGALAVVAERGPEPLVGAFRQIVADHRISGDLDAALRGAADALGDPVADRVSAVLRIAHRVGGRETGRVLRTLSAFLREDLAVRAEIEARQSWTRVAARVAAGAPWVVLLLVATRPEAVAAYDSPAGLVVLVLGAAATLTGYRLMVAIGRLPEPPRLGTRARTGTGEGDA